MWQSVFTRDLRRYWRGAYRRMHDVPTLVTGPSGTGKELVARAIGLSRFVPFDPRTRRFVTAFGSEHQAVSLAALSPALIESELFGHRRGAFTGATEDRAGYLEACGQHGTVFLDEIGELDGGVQVKLLRVLQSRVFQRAGETVARPFHGKIVAATHRDLAREMAEGRFRPDLYYRLCADRIEVPSLAERIAGDPDELALLVGVLARRVAGDDVSRELALDVLAFIERELPAEYGWPGNVRELEQCARSVLIRGSYRPAPASSEDELGSALVASGLTAHELVGRYCELVFAQTGSYVATGKRLELDRRTVKEYVTGSG